MPTKKKKTSAPKAPESSEPEAPESSEPEAPETVLIERGPWEINPADVIGVERRAHGVIVITSTASFALTEEEAKPFTRDIEQ